MRLHVEGESTTTFVDGERSISTDDGSLVVWVPPAPPWRQPPASCTTAAAGLLPVAVVGDGLLAPPMSTPLPARPTLRPSLAKKPGQSRVVNCLALRGESTSTMYSRGVDLCRTEGLPPFPLPNWSLRPVSQTGGAEAILAVGGGTTSLAGAVVDGGVSRAEALLVVACGVRSMPRKTQDRSNRNGMSRVCRAWPFRTFGGTVVARGPCGEGAPADPCDCGAGDLEDTDDAEVEVAPRLRGEAAARTKIALLALLLVWSLLPLCCSVGCKLGMPFRRADGIGACTEGASFATPRAAPRRSSGNRPAVEGPAFDVAWGSCGRLLAAMPASGTCALIAFDIATSRRAAARAGVGTVMVAAAPTLADNAAVAAAAAAAAGMLPSVCSPVAPTRDSGFKFEKDDPRAEEGVTSLPGGAMCVALMRVFAVLEPDRARPSA